MTTRISSIAIVIDCADPELLARFWSDLFGWKELWRNRPYVGLSMDEPTSHVTWIFRRVTEPRAGKNRSHPDFSIDGCLLPPGEFSMDVHGNVDYLSGSIAHLRED